MVNNITETKVSNPNLTSIRWANNEELKGRLKGFSKMLENDSQLLIENVNTHYRIIRVNDQLFFPVTVNNTEWDNAFVCSPFAAYAKYSREEIKWNIKNRILKHLLLLLVKMMSGWLKRGNLNKNVHVNNFLLTTNPYPEWDGSEISSITSFLKAEYPEHAFIFRSLNDYQHGDLLQTFKSNGYENIGSRQVYIFDLNKENWLKHRNNKEDCKVIKKKGLKLIKHEEMWELLPQALKLYRQLYLEKYSMLNPQFTLKYFQECYQNEIIDFQGYTDENGILKAFSGQFTIDNTITSPLVGYDIHAPKKDGLYLHAAQLGILNKLNSGLILNLSSGAPRFKRLRGSTPSIEYSALFINHLPWKRRIRWKVLKFFSNNIGIPVLKKYKL